MIMQDEFTLSEAWRALASCKGIAHTERNLFWPGDGDWRTAARAKKICDQCLVEVDCRQYAHDNNEKEGIWGGETSKERRINKRRIKIAAKKLQAKNEKIASAFQMRYDD